MGTNSSRPSSQRSFQEILDSQVQSCAVRNERRPTHHIRTNPQRNLRQAQSPRIYPDLNTASRPASANYPSNQHVPVQGSPIVFASEAVPQNRFVPTAPSAPSAPPRSQSQGPQARPQSRSNSVTRTQPQNFDVKCSTCKQQYTSNIMIRIYSCSRGHSSCKQCKLSERDCGVCGRNITDVRNIALENFLEQLPATQTEKCPNAPDGCSLNFGNTQMAIHIKECPFRELPCPVAHEHYCNWRGKLNQLKSHFNAAHPSNNAAVGTELTLLNICSERKDVYLLTIGNFHFLWHVRVSQTDRKIYMTAQLIGTTISANKWTYEIHIFNKREPQRKYLFADSCRSFNEPLDQLLQECSVIPLQYAMTFVNDGNLVYKIYIKKEIKNYRRGRNFKK